MRHPAAGNATDLACRTIHRLRCSLILDRREDPPSRSSAYQNDDIYEPSDVAARLEAQGVELSGKGEIQ